MYWEESAYAISRASSLLRRCLCAWRRLLCGFGSRYVATGSPSALFATAHNGSVSLRLLRTLGPRAPQNVPPPLLSDSGAPPGPSTRSTGTNYAESQYQLPRIDNSFIIKPSNLGSGRELLCLQHCTNFLHRGMRASHRRCDLANGPAFEHKVHHRPVASHNRTPLAMPRALQSRGHQRVSPEKLQCYSILTIALLDTHHGVTKCTRATP